MTRRSLGVLLAACAMGLAQNAVAQSLPRVIASGLRTPVRLWPLESGGALVAEAGNGPNTGRISRVTGDGGRLTIIDGLPAGFAAPNNDPSGASSVVVRNRTLFISISAGDAVRAGTIPGTEIPNPTPSSPLLSSVLALDLDRQIEASSGGFLLDLPSHAIIAAGRPVVLTNPSRETATLRLVIDIPNNIPNPRPDFPENVRTSNPFGLEPADSCGLWLVDASRNNLLRVDVCANTYAVVAAFPPYPNPVSATPPVIDAVPTSVRAFDGDAFVTFLTGSPFPAGLAEVRRVKARTGESSVFLRGMRMVLDFLPFEGSPDGYLVAEFSQNPAAGAPGRILLFDSAAAAPSVLTDQVIGPTHMAIERRTGELWICEILTGRIVGLRVSR